MARCVVVLHANQMENRGFFSLLRQTHTRQKGCYFEFEAKPWQAHIAAFAHTIFIQGFLYSVAK